MADDKSKQLISAHNKTQQGDTVDRVLWRMSIVAKILISLAIVYSIIAQEWFLIFSSVVALFFMLLPAIIERRKRVTLPVEIDAFISVFILVHFVFGEIAKGYEWAPWFDLLLHGMTGVVIALLGFVLIYTFLATNKIQANTAFIFLFTISLAMGISALWEIFEYTMDMTFGFNMMKSGLQDTMWDLIMTLVGAIVVSIFGYRYMKDRQKSGGLIHRLVKKVMKK